jgi:hypothetical protein
MQCLEKIVFHTNSNLAHSWIVNITFVARHTRICLDEIMTNLKSVFFDTKKINYGLGCFCGLIVFLYVESIPQICCTLSK